MKNQQLDMFPGGEDTPLFSGTPMKAEFEPFRPREVTPAPRLFVCATCQDTGKINSRRKSKTSVYCLCPAGQAAQSGATREALPDSEETNKPRELYPEPTDDPSQILREAMQIDNPALRLTAQGAQALTLIELLSLVLGTSKDPTIAARLLVELNSFTKTRAFSVKELTGLVPGITVDRACRLLAALELGERVRVPREIQAVVKSPADAAEVVRDMSSLEQEQMRVILLDTKNKVIHTATVYQGSVHTTVIRVGELMKAAVRTNATALVIAHNHPSGDPTPSPEDVAVTREIVKAAKLLDIDCLDHIVIGEAGKFVSLKERGLGFAS